ncbi:hypothetical protein ACL02O_26825 [Micromonospora sp. MS34]|uniref:hypothetical protein n=1 Tax=Micromonospora sp. MS34 TaxID=3385971 RepID=UPI0039A1B9B8
MQNDAYKQPAGPPAAAAVLPATTAIRQQPPVGVVAPVLPFDWAVSMLALLGRLRCHDEDDLEQAEPPVLNCASQAISCG